MAIPPNQIVWTVRLFFRTSANAFAPSGPALVPVRALSVASTYTNICAHHTMSHRFAPSDGIEDVSLAQKKISFFVLQSHRTVIFLKSKKPSTRIFQEASKKRQNENTNKKWQKKRYIMMPPTHQITRNDKMMATNRSFHANKKAGLGSGFG